MNTIATKLLIVYLLVLGACAKDSPPNLAERYVLSQEEDAKCARYYEGVGLYDAYSVLCRLPNKAFVYCTMTTDKGPQCVGIGGQEPPRNPSTKTTEPPKASPPAKSDGSGGADGAGSVQ